MRNNKGITLIALVITIIVLLILAGVSIAMLTGDNGILTQANTSQDRTKAAEIEERVNMEISALYADVLSGKTAFTTGASTEGTDEKLLKDNLSTIASDVQISVAASEISVTVTNAEYTDEFNVTTATVNVDGTVTLLDLK